MNWPNSFDTFYRKIGVFCLELILERSGLILREFFMSLNSPYLV